MAKYTAKKSMKKSMAKKEFTPCSRCPNPRSCMSAGKCLAKELS